MSCKSFYEFLVRNGSLKDSSGILNLQEATDDEISKFKENAKLYSFHKQMCEISLAADKLQDELERHDYRADINAIWGTQPWQGFLNTLKAIRPEMKQLFDDNRLSVHLDHQAPNLNFDRPYDIYRICFSENQMYAINDDLKEFFDGIRGYLQAKASNMKKSNNPRLAFLFDEYYSE